jgi:hypothetical protein
LKAVLKESFRLNPISVGIGRILAQDAIFSGYHVPKGVSMLILYCVDGQGLVAGRGVGMFSLHYYV